MGILRFLARLFGSAEAETASGTGRDVAELARRLDMTPESLRGVPRKYHEFSLPKRAGGVRRILAPDPALKQLQRRILRRILGRLRAHPAANGFERGRSIVSNAAPHVGQAVVVRMDLKNFFDSTSADRVRDFFERIGWDRGAAALLTELCTHRGSLPQGAPTSPRLSNLVNYRLDARLAAMAAHPARWASQHSRAANSTRLAILYTRYADDLTFSFNSDEPGAVRLLIHMVKMIVRDEGYDLHMRKKLRLYRRHSRQVVTGLVVNDTVQLPRPIRRWLRAIEHHAANHRQVTISAAELAGWRALQAMIAAQREGSG